MSSHTLDNQMEERLYKKVADLEKQLRDLRTLQQQGQDAIPIYQYNRLDALSVGPFSFNTTIAAGGLFVQTVAVRHNFPITLSTNGNTILEPSLSVRVGTDDPDWYLWPRGNLLSAGEKKLMVSIVRDWSYGLTPQDPQNNAVYHIQLHNLDSVSHSYFCDFHLYGRSDLGDFMDIL